MDAFDKTSISQTNDNVNDHDNVSTLPGTDNIPSAVRKNTSTDGRDELSHENDSVTDTIAKPSTTDITEGHRLHQLRKGLQRTAEKCVSAGRYSLFMAHLPTLGEKHPRALKAIQTQYLQKLKENIQCEIETMFKEENMASLMGELDQLVENTPESDLGAWRPSADAKENLRPHVMAVKEKQRKRLHDTFSSIESETKQLQDLLLRKRQKLQKTIKQCQPTVDKQVIEG